MIQILEIGLVCICVLAIIFLCGRIYTRNNEISLEKLEEQNDFERNKPNYSCLHKYEKIDESIGEAINSDDVSYKEIKYKKIVLQCNNCGDIKIQQI